MITPSRSTPASSMHKLQTTAGEPMVIEEVSNEIETDYYGKHGGAEYVVQEPVDPRDKKPWTAISVSTMGGMSGPTIRILPPGIISYAQAEALAESIKLGLQFLDGFTDQAAPIPDVPPVELTPYSQSVPEAGVNSSSFGVHMTGPGTSGTWTVTKDSTADWLTIKSPSTPQSSDGSVTYQVNRNSGPGRTANMYVNGKTFTVNQEPMADAGTSTVSASSRSFSDDTKKK